MIELVFIFLNTPLSSFCRNSKWALMSSKFLYTNNSNSRYLLLRCVTTAVEMTLLCVIRMNDLVARIFMILRNNVISAARNVHLSPFYCIHMCTHISRSFQKLKVNIGITKFFKIAKIRLLSHCYYCNYYSCKFWIQKQSLFNTKYIYIWFGKMPLILNTKVVITCLVLLNSNEPSFWSAKFPLLLMMK
jgi:hypothetical protein